MKRILIFSIAYLPHAAGAEQAVKNITDHLASYEFDLIASRMRRQDKPRERIGNVNVYRVGFGSRLGRYLYPFFAARLARKLHRRNSYQMVWAIMAAYAGAAALLFLARKSGPKFLLTLQEGDAPEHIYRKVRGFRSRWQEIFRRADYIQAISQYLADWAKQEGATCTIDIVPNGVNLENFQFSTSNFQTNSESQITMITTSRLVPKNGIDIFIRAARELKTLIRDSKFVIRILGSGPEEQKLKKLARDLNVEGLVEFVGQVEPERIPEYLSSADIFVRPSRSEGLGTSFLEAMAAGLPVVATRVGGIPDFLTDHENGLFVKVEDPKDLAKKITMLMHKEELRRSLGANGRKLVEEKYDWTKIAAQMEAIFRKLTAA